MFRHHGWDCKSVMTVKEALDALGVPPDAVILDLMLPDGEGGDVLAEIRQRKLHSKVIVTTGSSDETRLDWIRSLRPDGFMKKPVDALKLIEAVDAFVALTPATNDIH
jgi:DNA-binding response OmpR family regulator